MYRFLRAEIAAADDSGLSSPIFGPRQMVAYQTRDLEAFSTTVRVGPADSEAAVAIAPVTTGYFVWISSDYPVRVRFNAADGTQFVLKSNNVAATNTGAPLPDQCIFAMTGTVTAIRLQPISGATSTANVRIFVSGDPASSYD